MIARSMESIVDDQGLGPYRLIARPEALKREGLFAVEGRLVLPRLLASRYRVHSVLVSDAARESLAGVLATRPDVRVLTATVDVINDLTGYDFHRGCLALAHRQFFPVDFSRLGRAREPQPGKINRVEFLVLEGVSNPDNVGGIFRSAHAFGAGAVLLGPGCGDPLYRKAIRTSMGATLDVPWTQAASTREALDSIRRQGARVIALTTDPAAAPLRDVLTASTAPAAFLLGSEGYGLSPESIAATDISARIPMPHAGADSLNVAAAASIALYEATAR